MKSKKYLWIMSLLSIGTIATTITTFSCSNNASSENDSSNNKPPTDNDLPNNPEQPTPPVTPEEPKPPVTPEEPTPPVTPEEPKPPIIEEEKDNWNSYPSNKSIKITNIKSKVSSSLLHIEINGQNLSTNIDDYKIIINETGENIINYTNVTKLEFSSYANPPTKDNVVLTITFKSVSSMITIFDNCKKFIILIDDKAPILEPSAISLNIFPRPMSVNSINLKTEYDENNQPISLIYEVKGKNLYMDYNISDIDNSGRNEKIMIRIVDDQYNLWFEYEFLSDLSNTNEFIVRLTLPPNDFKKISGKKYNFLIINKWKFNFTWSNLYFPNF